jgi:hypothetical protein
MSWATYYFLADTPELLSNAEIAPGLLLEGMGAEILQIPSYFNKRWYVRLDHTLFDFVGMDEFYIAALETLKSGGSVTHEVIISPYHSTNVHQGDVFRYYFANITQNDISIPIKWSNYTTNPSRSRPNWVELGRYYWVDDTVYRESLFKYVRTMDQDDPEFHEFEGNIVIPPGVWDLNMTMSCITNWPWGAAACVYRLWLPQGSSPDPEPPDPEPRKSARRRRRAAWMDLERPAIL